MRWAQNNTQETQTDAREGSVKDHIEAKWPDEDNQQHQPLLGSSHFLF